jgi:hypothetical protein
MGGLMVIYTVSAVIIFFYGLNVLFHMKHRTRHSRRVAFLLITFGGAVAPLEIYYGIAPTLSASCITAGMSILFVVGARRGDHARRA